MSELENVIRRIVESRTTAIAARDAAAMAEPYAPDVVVFDVVDPLRRIGAGDVRARQREWLDAYEGPVRWERPASCPFTRPATSRSRMV